MGLILVKRFNRELANAIEHAFVLCSEGQIDLDDLPLEIRELDGQDGPYGPEATFTKQMPSRGAQSLTREGSIDLLRDSRWNKAEVARRVGLSRASIWKYMKK